MEIVVSVARGQKTLNKLHLLLEEEMVNTIKKQNFRLLNKVFTNLIEYNRIGEIQYQEAILLPTSYSHPMHPSKHCQEN